VVPSRVDNLNVPSAKNMNTIPWFTRSNSVQSYLRIVTAGTLIFAAAAMALFAASPNIPSAAETSPINGVYIVQMKAAPAVAYTGDISGYNATKPQQGQKIDPLAATTLSYVGYLKGKHDEALQKVRGGAKIYDYTYSFNGFAAKLTEKQAAALRKQEGVLAVTEDELRDADTSTTPSFLGLTDAGGLWAQLGGPTGNKKLPGAGEGIIIGVVDSGIWPESKSFSDRDANGKRIFQSIGGFHGQCESSETVTDGSWDVNLCNQKLIGARHFNAAWGGDAALEAERPWEFMSPRDYHGHGTHTTSTAGGNSGVPTTGTAAAFGSVNGMAPRARVAAYKALWSTQNGSTASGMTSDLVAAIDQAVADGVDVINYSVSGTLTNFLDPVEVSFLFAANAGVFVSASAGNSGPTTGTVAHPGPWLTTVAAGTHSRNGVGSVTLGNGATYAGASFASALSSKPLVDSVNVGLPGADPAKVELCYSASDNIVAGVPTPVLDPAKVAGKIVLCKRGITALVNKSRAVAEASGVGAVIYNDPVGGTNTLALFHSVPTVHVVAASGLEIKTYIAAQGAAATASIAQSTIVFDVPAPLTASFSSRGPLAAGGGDLLKPDVIAPGQDILAAISPSINGRDFDLLSGTSMSAPHVAGVAALLKQLKPSWTPMMIKSALMTSGYDVLDGGTPAPNTNPVLIFRQGAGHIKPNSAADPGLVYNSGFNDWLAFLCGTTTGVSPATCSALSGMGYSLDPSDLNVASIAIGDLPGVQTVKRKVTNVGSSAATYNASVTGMSGVNTVVTPSSLTLGPGVTGNFDVTFTRTTATLNTYTTGTPGTTGSCGQLTWTQSGGPHVVRIPIVTRPVALAAPAQVSGTGDPINYTVKFGYTGPFTATPRGLIPAATNAGTVTDDPTDSFAPGGPGTVSFDVVVPAGTTYARFSLFNDFTDGNDDLDLYVYRLPGTPGTLVGASGGGTSAEEVNLVNPTAATYRVYVHGFATDGPDANFTLFTWVLGSADAGNMTVTAPASATTGATGTIDLTFSGLAPATKYLGSVAYGGIAGLPNPTIVRVDTP
jgi:subtilisin family serine protease